MSIEAEKQEPVAWRFRIKNHMYQKDKWHLRPHKVIDPNAEVQPLYAAPPQREWQRLTDEEKRIAYVMYEVMGAVGYTHAIETKLKEKNT